MGLGDCAATNATKADTKSAKNFIMAAELGRDSGVINCDDAEVVRDEWQPPKLLLLLMQNESAERLKSQWRWMRCVEVQREKRMEAPKSMIVDETPRRRPAEEVAV